MTSKPTNNEPSQAPSDATEPTSPADQAASAKAAELSSNTLPASRCMPSEDAAADNGGCPVPCEEEPGHETLIRKKKRKHHRHSKNKKLRIAVLIAAILLALVLIAMGTMFALFKLGEQSIKDANTATDLQTEGVAYNEGHTIEYNGKTYALNENMASICIIGYDRRTEQVVAGKSVGQADAVMVLAANLDTGKVVAIGIPRDSMVEVDEYMSDAFAGIGTMQLCLSFAYGDGGETSSEYTSAAASRVLYNIPVNSYVSLDMESIGELADAIGGVAVTPLQTIPGTSIVKGQSTVLFGSNALKYVQWRDTSVLESPLDRQARQSQFVQAFCKEALGQSEGNVGMLVSLFNVARDNGVTNLEVDDFTYLASTVLNTGISGIDVVTLQGEMKQGDVFAEFYLDKTNVYETVLSVYYHEITETAQ